MKLTSAQVERTLGQFEARAIPDDHPVIPQLNDLFGEHTFFLDRNGLNIVEPAEAAAGAAAQSRRILHLDRTDVSLISQPHLEFFSGKNSVKPNAINPLRAAPVLKSRV
jgi:hypothetical protein